MLRSAVVAGLALVPRQRAGRRRIGQRRSHRRQRKESNGDRRNQLHPLSVPDAKYFT